MSNFRDWKLPKLLKHFQLRQNIDAPTLQMWIEAEEEMTDFEKSILTHLANHLLENVLYWNKQELSMYAIGPILALVNFTSPNSNLYALREISAEVDGEKLSGEPDGIIAFGQLEPEMPYFCFLEYEKDVEPSINPIIPCLTAMLIASEENKTVYGITVVGENWRFLVLEGRTYDISSSYSAGSKGIYDIFRILKKLKRIVAARVGVEM